MTPLNPDLIAVVVLILILCFFFSRAVLARLVGQTIGQTDEEFSLASRQIKKNEIALSMGASYSAFATVFFWFLALGGGYSYLLFIIPVCLFYGNKLFVKVIQEFDLDLYEFTTIGKFLKSNTKNEWLPRIGQFIVFVAIIIGLIVEINIGSAILNSIFPKVNEIVFVFFISITIVGYILIGGYRAVIASDVTQIMLAYVGAILLLVFALWISPNSAGVNYVYFPTVSNVNLVAFIISVLVVQFLGPICQLHNWQRFSSARTQAEACEGHILGAKIGGILWTILIIAGLLLLVKFDGAVDFGKLFSSMKLSGAAGAYAVYPLVMAGFVAALLSTADSLLASLYLFASDYLSQSKSLDAERHTVKQSNLLIGICFVILVVAIYYITPTSTDVERFTVTLIYILFNQLLVIFPILSLYVYSHKIFENEAERIKYTTKYENGLIFTVVLGWLTVISMGVYANFYMEVADTVTLFNVVFGRFDIIMFSSVAGVGIASISVIRPLWGLYRIFVVKKKYELKMPVTSPPIGWMDITVLFGAIGGYIASMRLMDKNPLALRNKLKEIFWTVSRFQEVISIGEDEFLTLTLADFENVPSRYKKGRHLIALYNLVFLRFYWLVSISLLTCTGLKIYLEIAKEDFSVQHYNEYNIYLMSSFGIIILSILLLCGVYSIFVGFESAKQKIDAKGDYLNY